jgi:uncharacterized cupin superfamily protein
MAEGESVWREAWMSLGERSWHGGVRTRHLGHGQILGATLHELPPQAVGSAYHFHHGNEEMLIVLGAGRPCARRRARRRASASSRKARSSSSGAADAHKCSNQTDECRRAV